MLKGFCLFIGNCTWYCEQQLLKDVNSFMKRKSMPQVTWPKLNWPVKIQGLLKTCGYGREREVLTPVRVEEIYDKVKKVEEMQKLLEGLFYGTHEVFNS